MCASGKRTNSTANRNTPYKSRNAPDTAPTARGRDEYSHNTTNNTSPSKTASYSMDGWRGTAEGSAAGKSMPQGRSVGLPHSS